MAFLLDGKTIQQGVAFTDADGNQYPANWLNLSSAEEKESIGLTEVADPEIFDNRFYWDAGLPKALEDKLEVKEDGKPLYVQAYDPKTKLMIDTEEQVVTKGLKTNFVAQIKDTTNKLLASTDWYVIRKAERNIDIPTDIADKRNAIITESNRLEIEINKVKDVEALIEVLNTQNFK
jgi:hypothetical protein